MQTDPAAHPTDIQLKKAGPDDLPELLFWRERVLREVFSLGEKKDTTALMEENRAYYTRALADGSHIACFAEESSGKIIGCGGLCLYREMPSPDNFSGICAYLMNIYTIPAYRRQGIGREIVRWLIARGRLAGAEKIFLEASEPAAPLYRKMGFIDLNGYMLYPAGKEI